MEIGDRLFWRTLLLRGHDRDQRNKEKTNRQRTTKGFMCATTRSTWPCPPRITHRPQSTHRKRGLRKRRKRTRRRGCTDKATNVRSSCPPLCCSTPAHSSLPSWRRKRKEKTLFLVFDSLSFPHTLLRPSPKVFSSKDQPKKSRPSYFSSSRPPHILSIYILRPFSWSTLSLHF